MRVRGGRRDCVGAQRHAEGTRTRGENLKPTTVPPTGSYKTDSKCKCEEDRNAQAEASCLEQMRRVHRHSAIPFDMDNGQTPYDQNRSNSAVPR